MAIRRQGARTRAMWIAVLTVTAVVSAPNVAAAAPAPSPGQAMPTPSLAEVFNGFVVGALDTGVTAAPAESFHALTADDPFYEEPPLTGAEKPGTLLKAKKVDVMFLGFKPGKIDAYKLMYVTSGIDGVTPTISTGIVMIPVDGTPPSEKKVVSYQEANDSVGWGCHPSTQWTGGAPLDGSLWSALGPLALMFGKGYAVIISDVGNDADRAPHGVFAGKSAGYAHLDAVRAAFAADGPQLDPHAEIALFGIAGGGVGSAFAAQSQPRYAPELNIKSTVIEGMVVKPRNFIDTADGSVGSGFAFATLLGLEPWYPEMRIDDKLNPAGKALAHVFRTQCQTPAYFGTPFLPMSALLNPGVNPVTEPDFQHAYDDNILGRETPRSKVLISSCAKDDSPMSLVPAADSSELADVYRSRGVEVTYQPTDCSLIRSVTDLYGWGTDLFGMQTIDWIDHNFTR